MFGPSTTIIDPDIGSPVRLETALQQPTKSDAQPARRGARASNYAVCVGNWSARRREVATNAPDTHEIVIVGFWSLCLTHTALARALAAVFAIAHEIVGAAYISGVSFTDDTPNARLNHQGTPGLSPKMQHRFTQRDAPWRVMARERRLSQRLGARPWQVDARFRISDRPLSRDRRDATASPAEAAR